MARERGLIAQVNEHNTIRSIQQNKKKTAPKQTSKKKRRYYLSQNTAHKMSPN